MEEYTMKYLTFLSALFIMTSVFTIASASDIKADSAELVIHIQGFENSEGVAKVAVCNSQESYNNSTPV
jgi:hypothetical protein